MATTTQKGRSLFVAVPFLVVGAASAGYGGMAIYSGYASKDWPKCQARATNFQIRPVENALLSLMMGGDTHDYIVGMFYSNSRFEFYCS